MKLKNTILFAVALLTATHTQAQTPDMFIPYQQSDLRLPSYPLLLNDPYFSLWSPHDKLYDGTTRHWSDIEKPMNGLLRVDGTAYQQRNPECQCNRSTSENNGSRQLKAINTYISQHFFDRVFCFKTHFAPSFPLVSLLN